MTTVQCHSWSRRLLVRSLLAGIAIGLSAACGSTPDTEVASAENVGSTEQAWSVCQGSGCWVPPECIAQGCDKNGVLDAMNAAAIKYGVPRWFVYAVVARESYFDPCQWNTGDGGQGLTQLTGTYDYGFAHPECLATADNSNAQWVADKFLNYWPGWLSMSNVSTLAAYSTCPGNGPNNGGSSPPNDCMSTFSSSLQGTAWDPVANLDRFFSGHAAPGYLAGWNANSINGDGSQTKNLNCGTGTQAAADCAADNLRRIYYHWGYGYGNCTIGSNWPCYPSDLQGHYSVLAGQYAYDWYVDDPNGPQYRAHVEADDGLWYGPPCTPPYSSAGCNGGGTAGPTYTSSATPTPSCRVADGGTVSIAATWTNTNNLSYTGILDIEVWDPATSTRVGQGYATNQTIPANGQGNFTWSWTVPSSQTDNSKDYTIKLGVFNSDFTANPYWNENAGTITIKNAATGCSGGTGAPTYTSSATPTPSCRVADGGSVAIAASFTNTNNTPYTGILDIEVWDGATKIDQGWVENYTISGNATGSFTWDWWVPTSLTGTASKPYTVKLGVFNSDWTSNPYWNANASTITISADSSRYNFECSSVQNWTFTAGSPIISSASDSTTQAYSGTSSLAVGLNAAGSAGDDVYTRTSPMPTVASTVVTYHVWVPSGTTLTGIQPYVKEGASTNFRFTGTFVGIANVTLDAWNTVQVTVPADATFPLFEMGVEFFTSGAINATAYIDSVSWQ